MRMSNDIFASDAVNSSVHALAFEVTLGVDAIDEIARNVTAAGGIITMQKSRIETVGTLIYFEDTEGNRVGGMKYDN